MSPVEAILCFKLQASCIFKKMKIRRWQCPPEPLWWFSLLYKVLDEVSIICAFYLLSLRFDSGKTHYLWKVAPTENELEEFLILCSLFLFLSS